MMQYRCSCGYNEEVMTGGGLLGNRETTVRNAFSAYELEAFDKAKSSGSLTRFFVENEPVVCPACRELMTLPVLHFWEGLQENVVRKSCPNCDGDIFPLENKTPVCPRCSSRMDVTETGLWD